MTPANPKTIYLKDYQPPEYLIERVSLHVDLGDEATRVVSTLNIYRNPASDSRANGIRLDGEELEPVYIELNGVPLSADEYDSVFPRKHYFYLLFYK